MPKHMVKCAFCGKEFDANVESFEKVAKGRRYVHEDCYNQYVKQHEESGQDARDQIHEKAKEILGDSYSYYRVESNINRFLKDGRTYEGILKALVYWYDVLKNNPKRANGGITIVDYIYHDSQKYWAKKIKDKEKFEKKKAGKIARVEQRKCGQRPKLQTPKRSNYFNLD